MLNKSAFLILFTYSLSLFAENACVAAFDKEIPSVLKAMKNKTDQTRWPKFGRFLDKYTSCLDGALAETVQGVSEEALTQDWHGFVQYAKSGNMTPTTLKNIRSGFSPEMGLAENLKIIQKNAQAECVEKIKKFCDDITKTRIK